MWQCLNLTERGLSSNRSTPFAPMTPAFPITCCELRTTRAPSNCSNEVSAVKRPPRLKAISQGCLAVLSRNNAEENERNHRWTQMDTDKGRRKPVFIRAGIDHQMVSRNLNSKMKTTLCICATMTQVRAHSTRIFLLVLVLVLVLDSSCGCSDYEDEDEDDSNSHFDFRWRGVRES